MFAELFTYDPASLDPETRERMTNILKARGEYLRASAEVSDLRVRAWAGETGLDDLAELKANDLIKFRQDYVLQGSSFIKASIDLEALMQLIPMLAAGVLHNFKVPLPVLLEAAGVDLDQLKLVVEQLKDMISEI